MKVYLLEELDLIEGHYEVEYFVDLFFDKQTAEQAEYWLDAHGGAFRVTELTIR